MNTVHSKTDGFAAWLTRWCIARRWLVILSSLIIACMIASGATNVGISTDNRDLAAPNNPDLLLLQDIEKTYAIEEYALLLILPKSDESVFTRSTLSAIERATVSAWNIPYTRRIDSLSSYQHSYADGEDVFIEPLYEDALALTDNDLARVMEIALTEPETVNQLVSEDGRAAAVFIVLNFNDDDPNAVEISTLAAETLRDELANDFPDLEIRLTGSTPVNYAIATVAVDNLGTFLPIILLVILVLMLTLVRSIIGTAVTVVVFILASMIAMGYAGFLGMQLIGLSTNGPTVILTLAFADAVHILVSLRKARRGGLQGDDAIVEALRQNFVPIGITTLTTIVGFLSLLFSDSPPIRDFGSITAVGIFATWIYSITLFPALLSFARWPAQEPRKSLGTPSLMDRVIEIFLSAPRPTVILLGGFSLAMLALVPTLRFNDELPKYFGEETEIRQATDRASDYFGLYPLEFSIPAGKPDGVYDPVFLNKLDDFANWLRSYPKVTHVYSIADTFKRINKNINSDDPAFYRLPETADMAAQLLLVYELSLPYGLDLTDRVSTDRSATRLTVTFSSTTSTEEVREFLRVTDHWFTDNAPELRARPAGQFILFDQLGMSTLDSMVEGLLLAVAVIALIMTITLRSLRIGIISLITNTLPIICAFGLWAIFVGEIGFSSVVLVSIAFGIIVDDTVHFLTKYRRGLRRTNSINKAIRYTYENVGYAVFANTVILAAGFLVLAFSSFKISYEFGTLTGMMIVLALILDLVFLPALLLMLDRKRNGREASRSY